MSGDGRDSKTRVIAFPVYPGVAPLDLIGPLTVLRDLRLRSPYRAVVVAERTDRLGTDTALELVAPRTFAQVPHPFGVIVPGGGAATLEATKDAALLDYVRGAAETASIVGSTGNGALVLAAAGLLAGRRAAIHWAYAAELERLGALPAEDHVVDDGRFLTAAGGSAGIDAMLLLTARLTSRSRATFAQLAMEYDPHPPFGGPTAVDRDPAFAAMLRGA